MISPCVSAALSRNPAGGRLSYSWSLLDVPPGSEYSNPVDLAMDQGRAITATFAADIVLAYIDGETLNLINGRAIPSEDLAGRIVANALRLFELLVSDARGAPGTAGRRPSTPPDPALIFGG